MELLPLLWKTHAKRVKFSITLGGKYLLAHPFVPGKEIAEAFIIVFVSMFLLLLATPLARSMGLLHT